MKKLTALILTVFLLSAYVFAQSQTVYPKGLKAGDMAPLFSGKDQNGKIIKLSDALKKGDVVLLFYRGQWCPYCNRQLSHFSDSLQMIAAKGATVIAITPETAANLQKTIEKTRSTFSLIEDARLTIMQLYKVNFTVDEKTVEKYKGYGIDFNNANGANGANLPVPATYIIGRDGTVKYVFFNTDYRRRASVLDILNNL